MALILYFNFKEPKIDKWTERQIRQTVKQTNGQKGRKDRQIERWKGRQSDEWTDKKRIEWPDRPQQTDRQIDKNTDRQTDRQTDKRLREVTDLRKEGINKDERVKEKGHLSTGDPQITIN